MDVKEVTPAQVQEMRGLVESGDLKLSETRVTFARISGRMTTLEDDLLLIAHAMTDDDDDDLLVANIIKVENEIAPASTTA